MDSTYIEKIETWGSGGCMLDVITLRDGRILLIAEEAVVLYPDLATFEAAASSGQELRAKPSVGSPLADEPRES